MTRAPENHAQYEHGSGKTKCDKDLKENGKIVLRHGIRGVMGES
jgi:hypothetical protein